ncbi:MAG: hypothetical protein PHX04_03360 [Bacilli bacterium]|nr:hypothetical protein [Bacilli bacterium]
MRWYKSTPISEIKEKAEASKKKLSKKGEINPIVIEGRTIAKNWWGKAWCEYLKKYADYDNRISRGRSYVSNGFIIDYKQVDNQILALVQGSRIKPYEILITFATVSDKTIKNLKDNYLNQLENIDDLLSGNFPEKLGNEFLESELFPKPNKEIAFSCTCPDHACLCKHISCALYGLGALLDKNPEVLFSLRGIKLEELISNKLSKSVDDIILSTNETADNMLSEEEANELFDLMIE